MIYSKKLQSYVPITVTKDTYDLKFYGQFTRYTVKDAKIPVGYVDIRDIKDGINVEFIKNQYPDLYSGFGKVADQLEVEHCLQRGLKKFKIISNAALNSHALHYLRGKRFNSRKVEEQVKKVIEQTPKGEKFNTSFIGRVAMYMPKELIKKYIEIIKKSHLLIK